MFCATKQCEKSTISSEFCSSPHLWRPLGSSPPGLLVTVSRIDNDQVCPSFLAVTADKDLSHGKLSRAVDRNLYHQGDPRDCSAPQSDLRSHAEGLVYVLNEDTVSPFDTRSEDTTVDCG